MSGTARLVNSSNVSLLPLRGSQEAEKKTERRAEKENKTDKRELQKNLGTP